MRFNRFLMVLAGVTLLFLVIVYIQFQKENKVAPALEEQRARIRILAPYETKQHQQILEIIGEQYSRRENAPQIVFEFVPKENMKKELSMRSLAGKGKVDIVICSSALMPELIRMGSLREISVSRELYNRVRNTRMWNNTKSDGRYYCIPFTCDPYVLYYQKDKLAEGQQPPKTWEELFEWGNKIRTMGVQTIGMAFRRAEEAADLYRLILYSMGGNLHVIEGERGKAAFRLMQDMVRNGLLSKEMIHYTQEDAAREFAEGKFNIMVNKLSASTILRTSGISFEIGMARIPDDEAGGTFLSGENIGLTVQADPAAWEFIEYLTDGEVSKRICSAMDMLPVFEDVDYQPKTQIYMTNILGLLDEARVPEIYDAWTRISEDIAVGIWEVIGTNLADIEGIAKTVHDKVRVARMSE